jgi:hypothetical protein
LTKFRLTKPQSLKTFLLKKKSPRKNLQKNNRLLFCRLRII